MQFFNELGGMIEARWKEARFDESVFPELSLRALEELRPDRHVTPADIVQHFASAATREAQTADRLRHRLFVLYQGRRFHLSALFWIDQIATPHHHGFAGAFQVLAGSRIHNLYCFHERLRVNDRFQLGDLENLGSEILHAGDARAVVPGRELIHALCHIDRPSVSIVVETQVDRAYPTMDYDLPHVACAQHDDDPLAAAQLKVLEVLRLVDGSRYLATARELLEGADLHLSYRLLEHAHERAGRRAFEDLLDTVRARHGAPADLLSAVFAETRRRTDVSLRRELIRDPDHRFLLGLLLYAPHRRVVFELVRDRFPDRDPAELVARWVAELASTAAGAGDTNVLDLPHDATWLALFRHLVAGRSFDEVRRRLVAEDGYDPEDVAAAEADLRELSAAIQESPLFRPLFVEA